MSEEKFINQLIQLRTLVGFLGEKHQANWWDTSFLNQVGQQYLTIAFPRSAFSAAVNCVTEAARRVHDEFIGKTGVFHLFRLPFALEERLHGALLQQDAAPLLAHLQDRRIRTVSPIPFLPYSFSSPDCHPKA